MNASNLIVAGRHVLVVKARRSQFASMTGNKMCRHPKWGSFSAGFFYRRRAAGGRQPIEVSIFQQSPPVGLEYWSIERVENEKRSIPSRNGAHST